MKCYCTRPEPILYRATFQVFFLFFHVSATRIASAKTHLNLYFPPPTKLSIAIYITMYLSGGGRIINKAQRRRRADGLLLLLLGGRCVSRGGGWGAPRALCQPLQGLLRREVPCTGPTQTIARRRADSSGWG